LSVVVATVGGIGFAPVAPGTVGTLAALPLFPLTAPLAMAAPALYGAALLVATGAAVWAAGAAEDALGETDSGRIVIDEVVGFLFATAFLEWSWGAMVLAFCLFRLFDIVKPFPASWADRRLGGGLGVVADDVVAGIYANLVARVLLSLL
jgi:phosphatidylglycerophosphatase A